jgi:hypothetical protein
MSVIPFWATLIAVLASFLALSSSPPRKSSKYGSRPVSRGAKRSKKVSTSASLIEAMSCSDTACATFSSMVSASPRAGPIHSSRNCSAEPGAPVSPNGSARWVTASQASSASSPRTSSNSWS